jgi:hypothetical protein
MSGGPALLGFLFSGTFARVRPRLILPGCIRSKDYGQKGAIRICEPEELIPVGEQNVMPLTCLCERSEVADVPAESTDVGNSDDSYEACVYLSDEMAETLTEAWCCSGHTEIVIDDFDLVCRPTPRFEHEAKIPLQGGTPDVFANLFGR